MNSSTIAKVGSIQKGVHLLTVLLLSGLIVSWVNIELMRAANIRQLDRIERAVADLSAATSSLTAKVEELQVSQDLLMVDIASIMEAVSSTARTYHGVKMTAYSVNSGATRIGKKPVHNWTAAVSPALISLLGRRVYIKELNKILRVTDTTHSDIEGQVIDIFVKDPSGWNTRDVTIIVID